MRTSRKRSTSAKGDVASVIAIVASAGGVEALTTLLGGLPKNLQASVLVVQHRLPKPKSLLSHILSPHTPLRVVDAKEGHLLRPGTVYVANADRHLTLTPSHRVKYSDGRLIRHVASSANPLFASVGELFGPAAIGVVLTGLDSDGTDGVQAIKRHGGTVVVQNQQTSKFFAVPLSAISTGAVDYVLPLPDIAPTLRRLVGRRTGLNNST